MTMDRRLCVAPMMDCTDRHFRSLVRLIAPRALLYTEMVTTGAALHGDRDRLLGFDAAEHPVALQLGGADPDELAAAARLGAAYGYDEINLNVGCPSDRVHAGNFGACLMARPEAVRDGVATIRGTVDLPVTVKTRIGVDDLDGYRHLRRFVATVAKGGCDTFIIHARKAWLTGLSPHENRTVPPLRYDRVARLKAEFPRLTIVLNGGIETPAAAAAQLARFDGVMIGRAARRDPFMLAEAEARIFGALPARQGREAVVRAYLPYIDRQLSAGVPLKAVTRHMTGLFHAVPGGRLWRRHLSEQSHRPDAGIEVVEAALELVRRAAERPREGRVVAPAA